MSWFLLQIRADDVNFWNIEHELLKTMEENKVYPPRFVLSVCSNEAKTSSSASLQFEGTKENTKINIILQHVPQGIANYVLSRSRLVRSVELVHTNAFRYRIMS